MSIRDLGNGLGNPLGLPRADNAVIKKYTGKSRILTSSGYYIKQEFDGEFSFYNSKVIKFTGYTGTIIAISGNGSVFASYSGTSLYLYSIDNDSSFTLINSVTLPATPLSGDGRVSINFDGSKMVVGLSASPYISYVYYTGTAYALGTLSGGNPTGTQYDVAFHPYENYFFVANNTSPYLYYYSVSGSVATKITAPTATSAPRKCRFTNDGKFLFATHSGVLNVYTFNAGSLTLVATSASLDAAFGLGCSYNGDYVFTSNGATIQWASFDTSSFTFSSVKSIATTYTYGYSIFMPNSLNKVIIQAGTISITGVPTLSIAKIMETNFIQVGYLTYGDVVALGNLFYTHGDL